jgi:hypothetical protein
MAALPETSADASVAVKNKQLSREKGKRAGFPMDDGFALAQAYLGGVPHHTF